MGNPTFRHIPISTRLIILFWGFRSQFGWAFFGFGLIFFWAFATNADLSFSNDGEGMITVEGFASGCVEMDASEGYISVFENYYRFKSDAGDQYEGVSYATGQRVLIGETLFIEYPQGKPQYSRIKGMRRKTFSPIVMFVVIFPLVGLIFILFGLRRSVRILRLLRNGILTKGVLISKTRTNTKINGRVVYKMSFRYRDDEGTEYVRTEKTHIPYFLKDQKEEKLLYLRSKPSYAVMLDSLPVIAVLNNYDQVESKPLLMVIFVLLFPVATIIGHGIYIINTYFS